MRARALTGAALTLGWLFALSHAPGRVLGQGAGSFRGSPDDPAIAYSTRPLDNAVVDLNRKLQDGTIRLQFEGRGGYLRTALEALDLRPDSQVLVFSSTSLQRRAINSQNPRALFFNDHVMLGWVRDGALLEVAVHDRTAGIVFYTLDQREQTTGPPQFRRAFECLGCHVAGDTLGVPGLFMFSATRRSETGSTLSDVTDQNTPFARRFGGWFVTGRLGTTPHMGNDTGAVDGRASRELTSVEGLFDTDGFRATSSDIAALLVLSHQTRMTNLLTRAAWEARAADPALHPPFIVTPERQALVAAMMRGVAREVVDYMLFIDEPKLSSRVRGTSGFAERFSALGPFDRRGRSLHALDLDTRLMKYPCSYLVSSAAFDALPPAAKDAIYVRLWDVLSGAERDPRYRAALSLADRRAIVEILRETKADLPAYFQAIAR